MSTLDDLVPQDHLVRTLEATIDWMVLCQDFGQLKCKNYL